MKTKTPRTKPLIIASTFALLGGLALANSITVKNELTNAVQTIQSVFFTADPASYTEQAQKVELKYDSNNQVQIQGQVLATHKGLSDNEKNTLWASAINSQLYYGQKNILEGSDSAILYGKRNEIYWSQNALIGGDINIIWENNRSSKNNFILWGVNNNINWQSSAIIGGKQNQIKWNKNLILAGEQKKVVWDQNYPFGSYIAIQNQSNNFVWSDAKEREENILFLPATSNSFFIRSANGVGINTTDPVGQGVTVAGMVQLGEDQKLTCNADTLGAMRFLEETREGKTVKCFQACERIGNEVIWRHISKTAECGYTPSTAGNQGENTPTPNQPIPQPQPQPINGQCGSEKNACVLGRLKEETDTSTHFKWKCLGENGGNDSPVCETEKSVTPPPAQSCNIFLSGDYINGNEIRIPDEGFDGVLYDIRKNLAGQTEVRLPKEWRVREEWSNANFEHFPTYRRITREKTTPISKLKFGIPEQWSGSFNLTLRNMVNGVALCEKTYTVYKAPRAPLHSYWYLKSMPYLDLSSSDVNLNFWKDALFLTGDGNDTIYDNPSLSAEWEDYGPYDSKLGYFRDRSLLKFLQDYLNNNSPRNEWQKPTGILASMFDGVGSYKDCSLRNYYTNNLPNSSCSVLRPDYPYDKKGFVFGDCTEPWREVHIPFILRKFEWLHGINGWIAINITDSGWKNIVFECKEVQL